MNKSLTKEEFQVLLSLAKRVLWSDTESRKYIYWTEQYLLYAYLLDNPKVEVLFGSNYANNILPKRLSEMMQGKYLSGGGSLWYELNASRDKEYQHGI